MLSMVVAVAVGASLVMLAARLAESTSPSCRSHLVPVRSDAETPDRPDPRRAPDDAPLVSLEAWDRAARAEAVARHPSAWGQGSAR